MKFAIQTIFLMQIPNMKRPFSIFVKVVISFVEASYCCKFWSWEIPNRRKKQSIEDVGKDVNRENTSRNKDGQKIC